MCVKSRVVFNFFYFFDGLCFRILFILVYIWLFGRFKFKGLFIFWVLFINILFLIMYLLIVLVGLFFVLRERFLVFVILDGENLVLLFFS